MSEIIVKMKSDYIKIKGGEYIRDLVRCKDCKHADKFYHCTYMNKWNTADGFCYCGEKL